MTLATRFATAPVHRRPRPLRARQTLLWVAVGCALIIIGVLIGRAIVSIGAELTGELLLNQRVAGDRETDDTIVALTLHYVFSVPVITTVLVLIVIIVAAIGWRRMALRFGLYTLIGYSACQVGKHAVNRPRPHTLNVPALVTETSSSFPSGHTSIALAIAAATIVTVFLLTSQWWIRIPVAAIAIMLPIAVAWSRIYVGAHYLLDVGGAAIFVAGGLAIAYPIVNAVMVHIPSSRREKAAQATTTPL